MFVAFYVVNGSFFASSYGLNESIIYILLFLFKCDSYIQDLCVERK